MKIFLDVGSNRGQTVCAVLEPRYGFDRIYCFEPVPELQQVIAKDYRDPRIVINEVGLWKQTCEKPIFSPGSQSGSILIISAWIHPKLGEMGAAARQKILEFSPERTVETLLTYYREILHG